MFASGEHFKFKGYLHAIRVYNRGDTIFVTYLKCGTFILLERGYQISITRTSTILWCRNLFRYRWKFYVLQEPEQHKTHREFLLSWVRFKPENFCVRGRSQLPNDQINVWNSDCIYRWNLSVSTSYEIAHLCARLVCGLPHTPEAISSSATQNSKN